MKTYYRGQNNNRADWWQNIADAGDLLLTSLGVATAQATWDVYLYRTMRVAYEEANKRVIGYANAILGDANGTPAPAIPTVTTWPAVPEWQFRAREVKRGLARGGSCGQRSLPRFP